MRCGLEVSRMLNIRKLYGTKHQGSCVQTVYGLYVIG